jgi:hypothetical protein
MSGRKLIIAIAVVGASVLVAPAADAHETKDAAKVTIAFQGEPESVFSGEVTSNAKRCIKNRKVTVFRRADKLNLGSVTSERDGDWSFSMPPPPNGDYLAKVAKKVSGSGKHKHICKPARSKIGALVAFSCADVKITGSDDSAGTLSVDDDLEVFVNDVSAFNDNDEFAQDLPAISLGALEAGDSIRLVASNSTDFGTGPVQIDPVWLHCFRTDGGIGSIELDNTGFTGEADPGEVFYDATYAMPDFFD